MSCVLCLLSFSLKIMKRFKILCVLLLTVFFASVVTDFVLDFIAGAKMGYNMVEYTIANGLESREHLYVDVVADGEGKALAPNAVNKLSGDSVVILRNNVSIVEYAKSFAEETDKHNVWYEILCWLNWVIIAIFVYLPLHTSREVLGPPPGMEPAPPQPPPPRCSPPPSGRGSLNHRTARKVLRVMILKDLFLLSHDRFQPCFLFLPLILTQLHFPFLLLFHKGNHSETERKHQLTHSPHPMSLLIAPSVFT